ncbi:MAG: xanthine dehydrogenase family protein molybdopterin-binding subunit [Vicinamibacterales bacterium]|jgi:xanthine dehydrogenase molybdenum-binding subunit|nr:4-hydroxybenzoyl-CoA reductase [Acidobacteriota bacterium]MDP7295034.1 xanthine dehydrogenase family protein molybdopterin-binding subunit [Vicinamibacterales bacterium]MDP7470927.1 xanthine dehydrogenase family protein molybdopterin-binding subunit [Vicinamibacterales bacterium]MDP7670544.1 xanthine dehydrogenase family protein molybdopterin-binding subunit [Vicinamibacterales bacterium]HJO38201.1 xanthine dehydrogenase family protein molybdopterin-binding subunit [Vicinamibacterales bacter
MSRHRHIGKARPRPDAADKAAGRTLYINDLVRPGMLHGKVKFSEHAHARIVRIDTSRAARLPGVRAVVTAYDTPEIRIGFLNDNFALKRGKVRQFRDEVAAVAAIDPDIAAEAVDLIDVEYEPLPGVFSLDEAMAEGAPLVHEMDARGNPLTTNELSLRYGHESGDLAVAERASAHVVEGRFSTQLMQQSCLGTAGCIAELDMSGNLSMVARTQIPFLAQRDFMRALEALGLPGRNCRVIVPTLGGAFGTGLDTHAYEYIAIVLAHRTNRPVKILYDREEEFANLSPRQSAEVEIAQGCDREGRLTFRRVRVRQDNGAYASWGATFPTVMLLPVTSLYRVPNVSFDARLVYTNNTYCQAMRGYGNPEVTWPIESNLDELAEAASIDPYELRMRNCNEPGETTPMGLQVTTCGLKECMEATAAKLDWGAERRARRGVGMASLIHVGGSGRIYKSDGGGVIMKFDDFGQINVSYGGVEMGQGLHSALSLTVAEALGVSPDKITINPTDTGTCPWDVGTHASRGAFIACNAALAAAEKARAQIFAAAEEVFPRLARQNLERYRTEHPDYRVPAFDVATAAKADRFELTDGQIVVSGAPDEPWLKVDLDRLLRAIHFRGSRGEVITTAAFYEPQSELPDWRKGVGNMSATYAYGAQGAEVEVDEETGEVRIVRMVAAHDVGKVLNPQTLAGQAYGGLAQGVGYALYEEVRTEQGRILNPSFTDYKIPTTHEMGFPVHLEFIETDDPAGPFGAKGVGEPGLVPTAPAIANAIYDAVGVRIRDLPITPEKVLRALDARRAVNARKQTSTP